jgi:hypothetical protein
LKVVDDCLIIFQEDELNILFTMYRIKGPSLGRVMDIHDEDQ